jgi:hypothetical protein
LTLSKIKSNAIIFLFNNNVKEEFDNEPLEDETFESFEEEKTGKGLFVDYSSIVESMGGVCFTVPNYSLFIELLKNIDKLENNLILYHLLITDNVFKLHDIEIK